MCLAKSGRRDGRQGTLVPLLGKVSPHLSSQGPVSPPRSGVVRAVYPEACRAIVVLLPCDGCLGIHDVGKRAIRTQQKFGVMSLYRSIEPFAFFQGNISGGGHRSAAAFGDVSDPSNSITGWITFRHRASTSWYTRITGWITFRRRKTSAHITGSTRYGGPARE